MCSSDLEDNNDVLLGSQSGLPNNRVNWITGNLDFDADPSNWDINQDITKSPMWMYAGKSAKLYKCPADKSQVIVNGQRRERVRSMSMSQVFGFGEWLDGGPNRAQTTYATFSKLTNIRIPVKTFVFGEEHPDSINDAAFATQMRGNMPTDPTSSARIIDFPASFHNGACAFSFADGHAEIHKWRGNKIKAPVMYNTALPLNVPAGDSWMDARWMAEMTTVQNK